MKGYGLLFLVATVLSDVSKDESITAASYIIITRISWTDFIHHMFGMYYSIESQVEWNRNHSSTNLWCETWCFFIPGPALLSQLWWLRLLCKHDATGRSSLTINNQVTPELRLKDNSGVPSLTCSSSWPVISIHHLPEIKYKFGFYLHLICFIHFFFTLFVILFFKKHIYIYMGMISLENTHILSIFQKISPLLLSIK